ncbi:MAG: hypothetical protein JO013_09155 [Alphaproteobacteria bacterium]|nr:hypothetical protein [Alphaproteobacteria bacterium]
MLSLVVAGLLAAPSAAAAKPPKDPNKIVCQSRAPVGSRLATVRECHTAQEWDEMRRSERLGLLRKQVNGDHGCNDDPMGPTCGGGLKGGRDTPW